MTIEKFNEDLHQARQELTAATAAIMELVGSGKAFGDEWDVAVARARAKPSRKCIGCWIVPWRPREIKSQIRNGSKTRLFAHPVLYRDALWERACPLPQVSGLAVGSVLAQPLDEQRKQLRL
jgi:hypothetical protein